MRHLAAELKRRHKKNAQLRRGGRFSASVELTLGVLRTLTRFTQTDFLTLDFTGIASHVAGLAQRATQGFVVLDQGTGDAVTDRTGLTAYATANDGNEDVELLDVSVSSSG